ncbi:MAG: right-handed parallel beta-helix repeat-containing protein, partial [Saprospiraceae bacterium]
ERNVISGNNGDGIRLSDHDNSTIAGNYIGVGADGTTSLGNNGEGVVITGIFDNTSVGCNSTFTNTDRTEIGNIIRNNSGTGIHLTTGTGTGCCFRNNSFGNNGELAIDLGSKGVRPNDNGDVDTGPNDYYNMPILEGNNLVGNTLTLTGFARPGAILDFYIADAGPNPNPLPGGYLTSFGEGQTSIATVTEGAVEDLDATMGTYDDDGTGTFLTRTTNRFHFQIDVTGLGISTSDRITAIATQPGVTSNTSEFGGITIVNQPEDCMNGIDDDADGNIDNADDECCSAKAPNLTKQ